MSSPNQYPGPFGSEFPPPAGPQQNGAYGPYSQSTQGSAQPGGYPSQEAPFPANAAPQYPGYGASPGQYAGAYGSSAPRKSSLMGILALIFGGIAAVVMPIVCAITSGDLAAQLVRYINDLPPEQREALGNSSLDSAWLTGHETAWTLFLVSFWLGTLLGLAAIVLGIVATATRRGRGCGIAGLVLGSTGWLIYGIVVVIAWGAGMGFALAELGVTS